MIFIDIRKLMETIFGLCDSRAEPAEYNDAVSKHGGGRFLFS